MQFHKERVAIGKRIEKAPRGVVETAASFASPESMDETIPTPFLEQITGEFCVRVNDASQQSGESPDSPWDLVAQVGIDSHPDGSDLVPLGNLPRADPWDPRR